MKLKKYWEEYATAFDEVYALRQKYFLGPALLKFLGNIKNKKVLDLGCGNGHNSYAFSKKGAKVIGLDSSKKMIDIAKTYYPKIEFIRGDATLLDSYVPKGIDIVVASQVFLTVPSREKTKEIFQQVSKVLKKEGVFIFTDVHFFRRDEMHDEFLDFDLPKDFNYFDSGFLYDTTLKSAESAKKMKFKDTFWNLSDYMSLIKSAGFVIEDIVEPKPVKGIPEKYKRLFTHYNENPLYIFFKLRKG